MEHILAVLLCLQSSLLVIAFQCSDKVIVSAVKEYNVENTHKHWFDCIKVNTVDSKLPSEPDSFLVKFQIGETKCRKVHSNIRMCPVKYGLNAVMGDCSALVSAVNNEELLHVSCNLNHGRSGGATQSGKTKQGVQVQGKNERKYRPGMFSIASIILNEHITASPPVLPVLHSAAEPPILPIDPTDLVTPPVIDHASKKKQHGHKKNKKRGHTSINEKVKRDTETTKKKPKKPPRAGSFSAMAGMGFYGRAA
ncbi:uncharacterized protein LOC121314549 isoform X1 [Polyodon spathula]|uniref:uncharacterized protein LOC121314549 isoform X1 n=1 Tax=Polyodon spathula TaxID=7913 RepID=UPI001B7F5319|nr:uncharacterized protein LOC121314549 isoform X1 [Polyodon spathula]